LDSKRWPDWWEWELELSPHVLKRMEDREFNEVDLRTMLGRATSFQRDIVDGRWMIFAQRRRHPWEIIVEPDSDARQLVVVTAYPVWGIR